MTVSESSKLDIEDLLGLPFSDDGDGPDSWNCWNLCCEVYRRADKHLPHYSDWIEDLAKRNAFINRKKLRDFWLLDKPEPLALVTLRMFRQYPNFINHIGIMISHRHFINVRKKTGVCIDDIYNRRWQPNRIEGFYRYAG